MSDTNYIDDLPASAIQQIFVPVCLPRVPNSHRKSDTGPDEIVTLYTCEDCNEKFVVQSNFKFHRNRCSLEIKYNCHRCCRPLIFYNRCNFLAHLRHHNLDINEVTISALDITTRPIPEKMMPYFTILEFNEANGLKSIPANSACPECKVNLTTSLKEHFNPKNYEKDWSLSCNFCGLIMPSKCSMKAHTRIHTKSGTLMCPDCCVSFPIWSEFWDHISNVCFHRHKVLRYECRKCTYIFKDCNKLQDHFLSRHLPKLTQMINSCGQKAKTEMNLLKTCDLCLSDVPQWKMKSHVLDHAKDRSALNIVYQCPYVGCYFCCSDFNLFKMHISSCLHKRSNLDTGPSDSSHHYDLTNSQQKDVYGVTDGRTKQALAILKSKGNIAVHRIESRKTYQGYRSIRPAGGFRSAVRMPLTPSPEPLSEGSGQGNSNEGKQLASNSKSTDKKTYPSTGTSILASRLRNGSRELIENNPVNEADVLVVKMHKCTICQELISYDKNNDALKMHFKNAHGGKYKLGQIKHDGNAVGSHSHSDATSSDSDLDVDAAKLPLIGMSSRNGASIEDSPPPLLKKQKPLAISPRRLANASRKEIATTPRKSWEIVSVIDSDDECLLSLKNRTNNLQAIGTARPKVNDSVQNEPGTFESEPGAVENELPSDSTDSGPSYKRKRKRGSSSDPDFECRELIGYRPQLRDGLAIRRRRRTLDKKTTKNTDQDRKPRLITPKKKVNGSFKRKSQEFKKSPHSKDMKAYYSDVVNEYQAMGSGIEIVSSEDLQSKDSFHCLKPDCLFTSNDSEAFREHIKTHRTDDNTFQCMECGLCFVVKPTFAKHLIINHSIKDVDAYIKDNDCCDKEIIDKNINELEKLEKRKTENVPTVLLENQCRICYKVCSDSLSLNTHFRTHGMAFLRMNQQEKNK